MATKTMKAFWSDDGKGPTSAAPKHLSLEAACDQWSDGRGMKGNFFGLTDDDNRTIQFYFAESIPDGVDDAGHLAIVDLDIPDVKQRGSHTRRVTIGEVHRHIAKAFEVGVDPAQFGELTFTKW